MEFESLTDAVSRFCSDFLGLLPIKRFSRSSHMATRTVATSVVWLPKAFWAPCPVALRGSQIECFSWRFWAYFCCICIASAGAGLPGLLPWRAEHMVKRSHFACRHNGSHAASAQYKVIRLLSASREIRHATTIQAATKLDFRVQSTQACWQLPSRRHHVSNPRLIKNTDGNLFRHLKSVQHSRLYRIDGAQR